MKSTIAAELKKMGVTRQRYARWSACYGCKLSALDYSEGWPPEKVRREWKQCVNFGHGAYECSTTGTICMTQPMYKPGCKCTFCKNHRALTRDTARAKVTA